MFHRIFIILHLLFILSPPATPIVLIILRRSPLEDCFPFLQCSFRTLDRRGFHFRGFFALKRQILWRRKIDDLIRILITANCASLPSTSVQMKGENPPLLPQVEMIVIGTFEESTMATAKKRTKEVLATQQTYNHQVSLPHKD